ncbi:MAG TPA: ribonuclease H-like domain-containing protein [Fimbriimonadaceae bacterium]|nr:ribonuclease H-like domain-containing protein [Fimbriimonadaceae bacterium]
MLQSTFCHVPGVGSHTEGSLWQQGCLTWTDYLQDPRSFSIGGANKTYFKKFLNTSVQSLEKREYRFFAQSLGAREAWRAWPDFRNRCVYLDIETDGGQSGESITMVGLYDGADFTCLVKGVDLDEFPDVIARYSMVVTFFGSGFDVPMLKRAFPHVAIDQIHLDLCHTLKRVGYRGGLKKIEKQLGILRGAETDGLSGYDAIRLWQQYQRGRDKALETLIEYNREDVVNLERLAQIAYDRLKAAAFSEAGLPELSAKF